MKMSPDVLSCSDDQGNLEIEINLPGVKKENIELKMVEDGFIIEQKRKKQESNTSELMQFAAGLSLRKLLRNTAMENCM